MSTNTLKSVSVGSSSEAVVSHTWTCARAGTGDSTSATRPSSAASGANGFDVRIDMRVPRLLEVHQLLRVAPAVRDQLGEVDAGRRAAAGVLVAGPGEVVRAGLQLAAHERAHAAAVYGVNRQVH